ncbi:MAG: hypothetical protein IJL91_08185 [Bacteroidales bacterium]|nr:hypothetical protein [Bacteroidales bacterium]
MYLQSIMVSCFDNIFETENPTHRPILEVLEEMGLTKKNNNTRVKSTVEMIRRSSTPVEQDKLKVRLLPVICPSGTFAKRSDSGIIEYNGIVCLDLDDVLVPEGIKIVAMKFPYTLAAMVSPTGKGVKIFVLTDLKDPSRHNDLYHHLGSVMGFKTRLDLKFDPSCSNLSRACFMSYDEAIMVNKDVVPYHVDLDTLPVYTPPTKATSTPIGKTSIAYEVSFPPSLSDPKEIRAAIKDSHTLFEEYYPMHQGVRNNNLYILAFFFRLEGIPEDVATDYLVAYYVDPVGGFTATEIKATVHSAYIH